MKNSHTCPKCRSTNVVHIPGKRGSRGSGNTIVRGRTLFSITPLSRYLCAECGFVEDWLDSKADIDRVAAEFRETAASPETR